MLLGLLGTRLFGNMLAVKRIVRACERKRQGWSGFLMLLHPLTNFEIQRYYKNKSKFNGVYSRNSLPKVMDGEFVIIATCNVIKDIN